MARRIITATVLIAASCAYAQVGNINEVYTVGEDPQIVTGYTVPVPVDTATSGNYYRTYNGLRTAWTDLELDHAFIKEHNIGSTRASRSIYAYSFSDSNNIAVDGTKEPGVIIDGTIHAREWVSPEIVTQLGEQLAAGYGIDPIVTYLIDQNNIVMVPVLNVDGFLQTQRYPDKYFNSSTWGRREGRLRRKNMRSVDEDINTTADNLLGVDLNRNFTFGWSSGATNSSSEIYRGTSSLSEPEAQALQSIPTDTDIFPSSSNLRCYLDMHGAIPAMYYIITNNTTLDPLTMQLALRMQSTLRFHNPIETAYGASGFGPSAYRGVSDEYFANTYLIPAFTIEYPVPNFREDGTAPNPFLNRNDEVDPIVEENIAALKLAMLFASGPPILEQVTVWSDNNSNNLIDSAEIVYDALWVPGAGTPATTRTLVVTTDTNLIFGSSYRLLLRFNKPMRQFESGAPANWPGLSFPLQPTVASVIDDGATTSSVTASPVGSGWLENQGNSSTPGYNRYAGDTWLGTFTLPNSSAFAQQSALAVSCNDLYGHELDARPQTVADWSAGWINYENSAGSGNQGGIEESFVLTLAPSTGLHGWQMN